MIEFSKPIYMEESIDYIRDAVSREHICGDGVYTKKCSTWLEKKVRAPKVLLTTSCTHALEMMALLSDIQEGDEIIMPSYTFASTADAFVLQGAKIVFVDIRPDTMNINEKLIEQAITPRTKGIVAVHYAGVACEMDTILEIAKKHNLFVYEDAAQAMMSTYKGKPLGTLGDFGTYSFHETKNYTMGEGGALILNHAEDQERAEILREKGTNRSKFWRGEVDKYTWIDKGSSYLPSEINAAYLWGQLEVAQKINENRLSSWDLYHELLTPLKENGKIELPTIPEECEHNAHMFYIKVRDVEQRQELIRYLMETQIRATFHYIPLHNTVAGKKFGRFYGEDVFTTKESERILRLPMYYDLKASDIEKVVSRIEVFFRGK